MSEQYKDVWEGSRVSKFKNLKSFSWLRLIAKKNLKYSFFRFDKFKKIKVLNKAGWHFSYLNTPELIEQKLQSYTHHREYDLNPIGIENIEKRIKNKESVYNLSADKRENQFSKGVALEVMNYQNISVKIKLNMINGWHNEKRILG